MSSMTSREFNQDTGGAKRAARSGPVYITDRGEPAFVLMTFEEYERLAGRGRPLTDLLSQPPGVETIDFVVPRLDDLSRPATFE